MKMRTEERKSHLFRVRRGLQMQSSALKWLRLIYSHGNTGHKQHANDGFSLCFQLSWFAFPAFYHYHENAYMKPKHSFITDSSDSAFYFQFEIILFGAQAAVAVFLFAITSRYVLNGCSRSWNPENTIPAQKITCLGFIQALIAKKARTAHNGGVRTVRT